MKPEEMSVDQLKVLAYDILVEIDKYQNNLKAVNQLIARKTSEAAVKNDVQLPLDAC